MKLLIVTTQPTWKSWPEKLAACRAGLSLAKGIGTVEIRLYIYDGGKPEIVKERITRAWFDSTLTAFAKAKGYDAVCLHISQKEAKEWGLKDGLRGSTLNDQDGVAELWVCADEDEEIRYPNKTKVNRFVKVFLHECSHWFAYALGVADQTHHFDYTKYNILGVFRNYRFKPGFFDKLIASVMPLLHPCGAYRSKITQGFGVRNPRYRSGIHNGTDYATPVFTPILAPTLGIVTTVWDQHESMGNACLFEFEDKGKRYIMRILHLQEKPKPGIRKRGEVIGYSGATGDVTGAHVHIEIWKSAYRPEHLLSEKSVRENLVDLEALFS